MESAFQVRNHFDDVMTDVLPRKNKEYQGFKLNIGKKVKSKF